MKVELLDRKLWLENLRNFLWKIRLSFSYSLYTFTPITLEILSEIILVNYSRYTKGKFCKFRANSVTTTMMDTSTHLTNMTSIRVPAKSGFSIKHGSFILLPVTILCLNCFMSLRGDDFTNLTFQQLNCETFILGKIWLCLLQQQLS